jgi:hypothetical protein
MRPGPISPAPPPSRALSGAPADGCFYLALAEKLQRPLVTADMRLVNAVRAAAVKPFAHLVVPLRDLGVGEGLTAGGRR